MKQRIFERIRTVPRATRETIWKLIVHSEMGAEIYCFSLVKCVSRGVLARKVAAQSSYVPESEYLSAIIFKESNFSHAFADALFIDIADSFLSPLKNIKYNPKVNAIWQNSRNIHNKMPPNIFLCSGTSHTSANRYLGSKFLYDKNSFGSSIKSYCVSRAHKNSMVKIKSSNIYKICPFEYEDKKLNVGE